MPASPSTSEGGTTAAAGPTLLRRVGASGRLPVALLASAVLVVLAAYGVAPLDALRFGGYVIACVTLPGILLLRALRGYAAHIAEDAALGLALGSCVLMGAYLIARAAGLPQLHVLWAVVTIVAFAAIPRLRGHWRSSAGRAPLAWTWAVCGILAVLLLYSTGVFATHRLTGTDTPYVDMPYHLALISELRHHVPPEIPYVAGEPLAYHWFFYVQAAAASWATGIEPVVLLYRLSVLPMIAAFVLLTAVASRLLTRRWWPGPIAVVIALAGSLASPYGWLGPALGGGAPALDTQPLTTLWISPTSTFGLFLLGAMLVVLLDRLGPGPEPRRAEWVLAAALVVGASGAKASVLPVVFAGLVTVVAVTALRTRTLDRAAVIATSIVAGALGFAILVLFGGSTGGAVLGLDSLRSFPLAASVGGSSARGAAALAIPAGVLAVALVLWAMQWSATLALLVGRSHVSDDRRLWLLAGAAAAGIGAATFLSYPGLSQGYFLRGVCAVLGLLTAWGIFRLASDSRGRWVAGAFAAALVAGAGIAAVVRMLGPSTAPRLRDDGLFVVGLGLALPLAGLLAGLAVAFLLLRTLTMRRWSGVPTAILVVGLAMGAGLPGSLGLLAGPIRGDAPAPGRPVPGDGIEAARWLRDHSEPGDLVATNLHCRVVNGDVCDARHFWVSAYAERRTLVEGWAITSRALAMLTDPGVRFQSASTVPFWDAERLAANDLAFTSPASGVSGLRDAYPVRWLFTYLATADAEGLAGVAEERFRAGPYAVFEVP